MSQSDSEREERKEVEDSQTVGGGDLYSHFISQRDTDLLYMHSLAFRGDAQVRVVELLLITLSF